MFTAKPCRDCVVAMKSVPCREALVQWTTRDAGEPVVLYGTDSGKLLQATFTTLQVIWVSQPDFQHTCGHAVA